MKDDEVNLTLCDSFTATIMYAMLTEENRNIIDRLIEQLIVEQSSNLQWHD